MIFKGKDNDNNIVMKIKNQYIFNSTLIMEG